MTALYSNSDKGGAMPGIVTVSHRFIITPAQQFLETGLRRKVPLVAEACVDS
jgi:hypothetical protein